MFVVIAERVPISARMASTGVMVLRRPLEPALSLLLVSGVMVSVMMVVRAEHGDLVTMSVLTSRSDPGGLRTT